MHFFLNLDSNKKSLSLREDGIKYIIDCTLGYPKGEVPNICDAMISDWSNDDSNLAIHYRVHKVQPEWVNDEKALKDWLYEQYQIKV